MKDQGACKDLDRAALIAQPQRLREGMGAEMMPEPTGRFAKQDEGDQDPTPDIEHCQP